MKQNVQLIQANISGFSGSPSTLFAAFDNDTEILTLAVDTDYRHARRDGCLLITNQRGIERDMLFTTDMLRDAIEGYERIKGQLASDGRTACLVVSERAQRANPANAIEQDGIDERGIKYRVQSGISNAQVAGLAVCHWAAHYGGMFAKREAVNDSVLDAILHGRGASVGGDYFGGLPVEPVQSLFGFQVDAHMAADTRRNIGMEEWREWM